MRITLALLLALMPMAGCNRGDNEAGENGSAAATTSPANAPITAPRNRVPAPDAPAIGNAPPAFPPPRSTGVNPPSATGAPGPSGAKTDEPPPNGEYPCVRVIDANTLELAKVGAVALAGVRAPLPEQPGARVVAAQLVRAVQGVPVVIEFCRVTPKNASGQWRVIVAYRDLERRLRNLNQLMLREGLAQCVVSEKCHLELKPWQQFQDFARQGRKGLWAKEWANGAPALGEPAQGAAGAAPSSPPTEPPPDSGGAGVPPPSVPPSSAPPASRPPLR